MLPSLGRCATARPGSRPAQAAEAARASAGASAGASASCTRPARILHVSCTRPARHGCHRESDTGPASPAAGNNPLLHLAQPGLCPCRSAPRSRAAPHTCRQCKPARCSRRTRCCRRSLPRRAGLCAQDCTASWTRFGFSCSGFVPFDARLGDEGQRRTAERAPRAPQSSPGEALQRDPSALGSALDPPHLPPCSASICPPGKGATTTAASPGGSPPGANDPSPPYRAPFLHTSR